VYAATSHLNWDAWNESTDKESLLVVRYANNASALVQWVQQFPAYNGSAFIGTTATATDGGDLTQPVVDGDLADLAESTTVGQWARSHRHHRHAYRDANQARGKHPQAQQPRCRCDSSGAAPVVPVAGSSW